MNKQEHAFVLCERVWSAASHIIGHNEKGFLCETSNKLSYCKLCYYATVIYFEFTSNKSLGEWCCWWSFWWSCWTKYRGGAGGGGATGGAGGNDTIITPLINVKSKKEGEHRGVAVVTGRAVDGRQGGRSLLAECACYAMCFVVISAGRLAG